MGIVKWAALSAVAMAFAGVQGGYTTFAGNDAEAENTRYLLDRYKAAPSLTAEAIRQHASACLQEKIGLAASSDLRRLFGAIMVYTVRHAEDDSSAFVSGYQVLAEREGPAVDASIAFLPTAEKKRVAALVDDLSDGPDAMVSCVAGEVQGGDLIDRFK
jgi:hypothetical protein